MSAGRGYDQALDAVLSRAATDVAFRNGLLADPRATIRTAFNINIPDAFRIKFVEREPDLDALVVLPDLISSDGELGDAELETVHGGGEPTTYDFAWSDDSQSGGD